jgi:hypothetical protein
MEAPCIAISEAASERVWLEAAVALDDPSWMPKEVLREIYKSHALRCAPKVTPDGRFHSDPIVSFRAKGIECNVRIANPGGAFESVMEATEQAMGTAKQWVDSHG